MDKQIGYGRLAVAFLLNSALFNDCCVGARFGTSSNNVIVAARIFPNITASVSSTGTYSSVLSPSTSSSLSLPTITVAATLSNALTTDNSSSTMTTAPEWGNQSIPLNTCSTIDDSQGGQTFWTPCHVFAGTVQLSFFPEASGDVSYPTTYYDSKLSATLTSPSIYMVVNTITGHNDCGPLGPDYATKLISMDLTDVYTLPPYEHASATSRGEPQPLTLADLADCTYSTKTHKSHGATTTDEVHNSHPVNSTYNRCNPRLVFPIQLKRAGYPYWKHCGNDHYKIGLFDPPGAVPSVDGLFTSVPAITSTTEVISAAPTAIPDLASSTQTQEQISSAQPAEASPTSDREQHPVTPVEQTPTTSATPDLASNTQVQEQISSAQPAEASPTSDREQHPVTPVEQTPTTSATPDLASNTQVQEQISSAQPAEASPTSDREQHPVTPVEQTQTTSAAPFETTSLPSSETIPGGTLIQNSIPPQSTKSPGILTVIGSNTIIAIAGSSGVLLDSSTATIGQIATFTDLAGSTAVISVGSSGIFIGGTDSKTTFLTNPTQATSTNVVIAGQTISAAPGGYTVVIGSQTASIRGNAITLDNHDIVSVGPSGVVVQHPGGAVSTIALGSSASSGAAAASTSTTTNEVAVAIASIIGASGLSSADTSSTPTATRSTVLATGAAEMIRGKTMSALGSLLLGFVFAL